MSKYKFKILAGGHTENLGTDQTPKLKKYVMGDIVESNQELDRMFNSPGATKFARLDYEEPDTEESLKKLEEELQRRKAALKAPKPVETADKNDDDNLSKKSIPELREIAKANGIDLGKANSHDAIRKIIEEATVSA